MGVKKTLLLLDAAAISAAIIINVSLGSAKALSVGGPSDCNANSVIPCGAHTTASLISDYRSMSFVQKVYAAFGVSSSMINSLASTNVAGTVTKSGEVFINSQTSPVATGAITGGRQDIAGSQRVNFEGITFFRRPPSVSFAQASLPAFVSIVNGQFSFAVIASCGNMVVATPTTKPAPKPTPSPKPTPQTPTSTMSNTNSNTNTNNNANVQSQSQSQSQQVVVQPAVQTQSSASAQSAAPPASSTAQVETSAQPVATTTTLPNTGPGDIVGIFGLSSLMGLAGHHWITRRRARV